MTRIAVRMAVVLLAVAAVGCPPPPKPLPVAEAPVLAKLPVGQWTSLFDGKSLSGWKVVEADEFSEHGPVTIKEGAIRLASGGPFTAVAWAGDVPRENFEIEVEVMRPDGYDIFCGLTFPVGKGHVSLVCGGWGDTVVGISSIDDLNASENETTTAMGFENGKWHRIRVRVTEEKLEAWVGDKQVVDIERGDRRFSLYGGVEPVAPLGVFTWQTEGRLRSVRFRRLPGTPKTPPKKLPALPEGAWTPLFDGKSLKGWTVADAGDFALRGKVQVSDGVILMAAGEPMTGIACTADVPRTDYEVALDAMREDGSDFFCGLTFPVGTAQCTLILGGWGGSVVGLSNVDDEHAAENVTTRSIDFNGKEWYRVRVRVTAAKIEAWLDSRKVIDLATKGHTFTIWPQQEPMKPLGIATYYTAAALRNVQVRKLKP